MKKKKGQKGYDQHGAQDGLPLSNGDGAGSGKATWRHKGTAGGCWQTLLGVCIFLYVAAYMLHRGVCARMLIPLQV